MAELGAIAGVTVAIISLSYAGYDVYCRGRRILDKIANLQDRVRELEAATPGFLTKKLLEKGR